MSMGDTKDSKKIQADRAARKNKEKDQAKRSQPDTTSAREPGREAVPMVTKSQDQVRRKNGSK
jgi:hypothetical protein